MSSAITREPLRRRKAAATMVSLAILLLAVSLWRQRMSREQALYLEQAADQWAYYNSKAILTDQYQLFSELFVNDKLPDQGNREVYRRNSERYEQEKVEIRKHAEELEAASGALSQQIRAFSFAEALFEFAIMLCFLAIFTGRSPFWYFALLGAAGGVALACLAFV